MHGVPRLFLLMCIRPEQYLESCLELFLVVRKDSIGAGFKAQFDYGFFQFQSKTRFSQALPAHPWWCRNPVTSGGAWCPAPVPVDVYKARAILGTVFCRSQGRHGAGFEVWFGYGFFQFQSKTRFNRDLPAHPWWCRNPVV